MNIILGVTGGIAAYKSAELTSRLKKAGHSVRVIMTRAAREFVAPRTFAELSGNRVITNMWEDVGERNVEHIALAEWADMLLVAPATANFIAKAAVGIADDMLTTVLLATKAPIMVAPAMNTNMLENPITQKNIAEITRRGFCVLETGEGLLACGAVGAGRLLEPQAIAERVERFFATTANPDETKAPMGALHGKKIIVTAGGTIAPIDPVRFIANRSSGKMGIAVARAAATQGAHVELILGRCDVEPPKDMCVKRAETTEDMRRAVLDSFGDANAVIMTAAVADYRVKEPSPQKIKKSADSFCLELIKNPDILKELGTRKKAGQILVGFAAETENIEEYAKRKLVEKNLDFIVANDVSRKDIGFNSDNNAAILFFADGKAPENCPFMTKTDLAERIMERLVQYF